MIRDAKPVQFRYTCYSSESYDVVASYVGGDTLIVIDKEPMHICKGILDAAMIADVIDDLLDEVYPPNLGKLID